MSPPTGFRAQLAAGRRMEACCPAANAMQEQSLFLEALEKEDPAGIAR